MARSLPSFGDVEGIETEDLARSLHFFGDRDGRLIKDHTGAGRLRDLAKSAGDATARRIAKNMNVLAGCKDRFDQAGEGGRVAGNFGLEFHPSRTDMMAIPWTAIGPLRRILSPARRSGGVDVHAVRNDADARRVDEDLIRLASVDHLGVTGDKLNAGCVGRLTHRPNDAPEILNRRSFLDDQSGRKIERARAAHGEVVDRAMHGADFRCRHLGRKWG